MLKLKQFIDYLINNKLIGNYFGNQFIVKSPLEA